MSEVCLSLDSLVWRLILQLSFQMSLSRGVCLIAGAGPGIGQAVARRFARDGFKIVAVRRNKDQLQSLTADIEKAGKLRLDDRR